MNEKDFVAKAKNGDVKSFCTLYDTYKTKLYNYAYYRLGNKEDAEDAVQECVLTAYEQLGNLKKNEAFSSWLFAILYHLCISSIKNQIKQKNNVCIDDCKNTLTYEPDVDFKCEELKEALNILNEQDKNLVLLSVVGGLNSKEISKITGFSSGNVRTRICRSCAKMRSYLS